MNPKDKNSYMGRSAHLAVMSKLAAMGYRVTVPEVDVGKDVLAFLDTKPNVTSVQVKSAECKHLKKAGAFSGKLDVPEPQLMFGGDLYYIFVFRLDGEWVDYMIISREKLYDLRLNEGIGTAYRKGKKNHLKFTFSFSNSGVKCGEVSFSDYRNSWEKLPDSAEVGGGSFAVEVGHLIHTPFQTTVASKLLSLGCNVAMTEIDKLLTFQDEEPGFTHILVKGSNGVAGAEPGSYTAELQLSLEELKMASVFYYVFSFQFQGKCTDFVIISRKRLDDLRLNKDIGYEYVDEQTSTKYLKLAFSISHVNLSCGGENFAAFRDAWTSLPPLAQRPGRVDEDSQA